MSTGIGRRKKRAAPRSISLALQGGGAHGAFTWGVLDALLEDGRLDLRGASGTSASMRASAASSTRRGAVNSTPPWTTRWPAPTMRASRPRWSSHWNRQDRAAC